MYSRINKGEPMSPGQFLDKVDKHWTLFLDRDGVLNRRIVDDYVRVWEDWEWLPGVLPAIASLSSVFGRMVVVTNQRGIALGYYSEQALMGIHQKMKAEVRAAGGRIDAVFHCPHDRDSGCSCRKPQPGMLLNAAASDSAIDLQRAIMVGDSISDMQAAEAVRMPAIFIGSVRPRLPNNVLTALPDLPTVARLFEKQ
ncbi:MAG: hypothetical protein RLZZ165_1220 [Bacteroidota bacterium]|jgi:histidinol-phosphate phosphatase family protein